MTCYGPAFGGIEGRSMEVRLEVDTDLSDGLRNAILGPVTAFHAAIGHPPDSRPLAIVLRDAGRMGGWPMGRSGSHWLFVEIPMLDEGARGRNFGAGLMQSAEELFMRRDCVGLWLTTFPFQARGSYEKLGYSVFAGSKTHRPTMSGLFMRQRLGTGGTSCRSAGNEP